MRTTFFPVVGAEPGRLAIVGRPRGGDWLEDEFRGLRDAGVDVLGIGRSALVAASLLRLRGVSSEDAWRQVAEARGAQVPDTHEQRAWVAALEP